MFQTIENAALTVQTQFGVNYEIGKFTTLRIKWYGISIISWKCVRLAFDVSLTINLCTLCTLNRNRGKSCRHCWPCIAAVVGFWQSQRLGFLPNAALITFLVSKRVTPKRAPSRLICWIGNLFRKKCKLTCLSFSYAPCRSVCFGKGELRPPCRATLGKQFRQAWSLQLQCSCGKDHKLESVDTMDVATRNVLASVA